MSPVNGSLLLDFFLFASFSGRLRQDLKDIHRVGR